LALLTALLFALASMAGTTNPSSYGLIAPTDTGGDNAVDSFLCQGFGIDSCALPLPVPTHTMALVP
jgi:hypothetical protein